MAHGHWKRLGDGSLLTEDADEGLGHIQPIGVYAKVLGALLVLTILTVWVAQYDFGHMNAVVALAVASVKALMVAMFFMHLKFEGKWIIMYAIYPIVLLVLLIGGTFLDEHDRDKVYPKVMTPKMIEPLHTPAPDSHH